MTDARSAMVELLRRQAKVDMLAFLQYCWWMPGALHIGRHTRALCSRLTRAVFDLKRGKDTYLIVTLPFRHGKSDLVSRALPAFFLGLTFEEQYNYPYYRKLIENLGYEKETDWVERQLRAPAVVDERIARLNAMMMKKYKLHKQN